MSFPGGSVSKELACQAGDCLKCIETGVQYLGRKDPLEKGVTTFSSMLAWEIPWIEEPGGPQSLRSQNVRHN